MKKTIENVNGYDVEISAGKDNRGRLYCSATFGTLKKENGWNSFTFAMFTDPYMVLAQTEPGARATQKALETIFNAGMQKFEELRAAGELPSRQTIPAGTVLKDNHGTRYVITAEKIEGTGQQATKEDGISRITINPNNLNTGHANGWNATGEIYTPEQLEELRARYEADHTARMAEIDKENQERKDREKRGREAMEAAKPAGAVALIIGEYHEDRSDPQSDYFGHETTRRVALSWSYKTREDFTELRRAARNFEGTADLADGPADLEQRENYSGGAGYYLGTYRHRTGWKVMKSTYWSHLAPIFADPGNIFIKEGTQENEPGEPTPTAAGAVQIIDYSEKAVAVIGDTKPIKDKLKDLGGRFNFRLTCGPGWIFPKTKIEALVKALNIEQTPEQTQEEAPELEGLGALAD